MPQNQPKLTIDSGAPPSGWIDYITKLPLAKLERVKSKNNQIIEEEPDDNLKKPITNKQKPAAE
jgi:hypothetical protein